MNRKRVYTCRGEGFGGVLGDGAEGNNLGVAAVVSIDLTRHNSLVAELQVDIFEVGALIPSPVWNITRDLSGSDRHSHPCHTPGTETVDNKTGTHSQLALTATGAEELLDVCTSYLNSRIIDIDYVIHSPPTLPPPHTQTQTLLNPGFIKRTPPPPEPHLVCWAGA